MPEEVDRDELAVLIAEQWWPNRYVGDLSRSDWDRIYKAIDSIDATLSIKEEE